MDEMNNTNCKSCGEPGMKLVETTEYYTAPFGKPIAYQQMHTECDHCGMEFDVSNPEAFPNAIREAEILSVEEMLKYFKENKISHGRIERALDLPHRQVSNWKSKEAWSKSGLALMRILRAYPWIIDVADKHFEERAVRENLLTAASSGMMSHGYIRHPSVGVSTVAAGAHAWGLNQNVKVDFETPGLSKMVAATAIAATALMGTFSAPMSTRIFAAHPNVLTIQENIGIEV